MLTNERLQQLRRAPSTARAQDVLDLIGELVRKQALVESLAERVASQSALLTRRAERAEAVRPCPVEEAVAAFAWEGNPHHGD